jgi:phosphoribosyl-ATP pyrophosphohydrolase/phosphoribosyl-AMP cyclohydrolase/histidinol dehydrogenase
MSRLREIDGTTARRLRRERPPDDAEARAVAEEIVGAVRREGVTALRRAAERFGELRPGAPLWRERSELEEALRRVPSATRALLERTAERVAAFARAQRAALLDVEVAVPGGAAGHRFEPLARVGCYAPGGRHPLPSSVLMTVIPARVAGVSSIVVSSPRPTDVTLAAAALAGADRLLACGGAQAIGALACGVDAMAPCDLIAGPGNRFVAAAKRCVAADVAIDLHAGPSELLVVCDAGAEPALVAADLLAQAEHDVDARPWVITPDRAFLGALAQELDAQIATLPGAAVAAAALRGGFAVVERDLDAALALADELAAEHLELHLAPERLAAVAARRPFPRCGTLFLGAAAGEVTADYGAGPNHVLPTGGAARREAGLSVATFLRARTWLRIDDPSAAAELARDAAALARLEGLEGHARAAERRLPAGAGGHGPRS